MSLQRFLLVILVVCSFYKKSLSHPLTPKIDSLKSTITALTYRDDFRTAQKEILNFLADPNLSPVEIFYGHFLLADIIKSSGNYQKAIELLLKSKEHISAIGDRQQLFESLIYGNISECHFNALKYDSAQIYALRSLKASPDSSLRGGGHAVNNIIIGFSNFIVEEYDTAIAYYKYAIKEYLRHGESCELPLSYIKIANIYWKQGKNKQAEDILIKALHLSDSCNINQYKLLTNIALFDYNKYTKQYKRALELVDTVRTLRTIIYDEQQQQILRDLEVKYQTELTIKENENLKKRVLIENNNSEFKITILFLSVLVLLLLLFSGVFMLRMRHQKNKLMGSQLQKIANQSKEREALLKEIHHRVKNNLQIITSLLHLQANQNTTDTLHQLVDKSQYRINAMAMVHEMLYQSDNLSKINLKNYLKELVQSIILSTKGNAHRINIDLQIPALYLGLDTAIPLGLLINEIVTNSLVHGIKDDMEGEIYIHIEAAIAPNFKLFIGDNGVGYSKDTSFTSNRTLGLSLMKKLSRQLLGSIEMERSQKGCHYIVTFKEVE